MIEEDVKRFLAEWNDEKDSVLVHTSGSTGQPKALWVEKQRMLASARITCDFLGLKEGDTALLCLSPDYIAGTMMVVRALERGLHILIVLFAGLSQSMKAPHCGHAPSSLSNTRCLLFSSTQLGHS